MTKRVGSMALLALVVAATPLWAQSASKPNIVVLLADDLGYADLGVQGNTDIPTPHIDSIANAGVRFTDGYSNHHVCSPARAGLLSGMYQHRFGFEHNSGPQEYASREFGIPRDIPILPESLKAAGYRTAMIGKWHVGFEPGLRPHERGFDRFYGFLPGAMNYNPAPRSDGKIFRNGEAVKHEGYLTDVFGEEASAFIKGTPRDTPFFVYLSFNAVHLPLEATPRHEEVFGAIAGSNRRTYAGMLKAMDDAVGRVLETLREEGIEEETLVFFYSDNGGPTHRTTSRNDPLRGVKGQTFEGGIRVPFMVQWKGRLPRGQVRHDMVMGFDVHATALAVAGIDPSTRPKPIDGVNLLPYLLGESDDAPHTELFWRSGSNYAARVGNYKLVRYNSDVDQLFDLAADIGESKDLATSQPDVLRRVQAAYARWDSEMTAPRWIRQDRNNSEVGGRLKQAAEAAQAAGTPPLAAVFDANGDGVLQASEVPDAARRVLLWALDADGNEVLDRGEIESIGRGGAGRGRQTRSGPDNWDFSEETADGIRIVRNLEYATGTEYAGGRGKLDLYVPAGTGPHPVVVFFHGGGLYNGDKHSLIELGARFASLGYLVAAPNYRLSPEFYYPAYIEDAATAFRWVWDHVADYGGDRDRIAVSGGSAGGHLTALLSVDQRYLKAQQLGLRHIRASLPITGLMDAERAGRERQLLTWKADRELAREASPIRYVGPDLPPMLITVADGDTEDRRSQNVAMHEAMKEAGAEVEFEWLTDRTHGSILPNMLRDGDRTVELILAFLRKHGMAP